MAWYYAAVFITALAMADLNDFALLQVGGQRIIAMDLFNACAVVATVVVLAGGGFRRLTAAGRWYAYFLGWLVVETVVGYTRYSASAIGEFRYVALLFWFWIPIAIEHARNTESWTEAGSIGLNVIGVAAAAGVLMFFIEVMHGGRVFLSARNRDVLEGFTDFRGVRYLDTYQAFNIMLASCTILLRPLTDEKNRWGEWFLAAVLAIIAIWTRNRAAIVALVVALSILAILRRRVRLVLTIAIGSALAVVVVALLSDPMMEQIRQAFSGVLNPAQDDSGRWRLFLQLSAIEQALKTPFLGQGYGGYYYFEVPGMDPILAPPHNQYIELFLKCGVVGLSLCLVAMWKYGRSVFAAQNSGYLHRREKLTLGVVALILLSLVPYGLAYDFPPIFGLLLGGAEIILQRRRLREEEQTAQLHPDFAVAPALSPAT